MNESNFCSSRAKGKKARPVFFLALSKEKTPQKTVRPALKVGNKKLVKYPVSNETLLAGSVSETFPKNLKDLLCEKIMGLVKQCCLRGVSSKVDLDDLVDECWLRIWNYRHTYDYNKAKVSTWVTWVCRSVVGLVNKKTARHYQMNVLASVDEEEDDSSRREPAAKGANDCDLLSVREAIKEIKKEAASDPFAAKIVEDVFDVKKKKFLASFSELALAVSYPKGFFGKRSKMSYKERTEYKRDFDKIVDVFRGIVFPAFRRHCNYESASAGLAAYAASLV